ncbi:MAG: hypothetical protein HYZ17_16345 [Betaproteobacteria bacterium]|nr:hypothetical protein [Betaproteobacteria bacterium]
MTDTVVVIGAGPAGQVSGEEVDRYPVVRMWNHDWQPAERFGSRYDYGLITRTDDVGLASRRPGKWLFYNVPNEPEVSNIDGTPVVMLDKSSWYSRAQAHGAKPGSPRKGLKFTRGFAAVAGTIDRLRPRRIVVIGMSILRDGVTGARYYDPDALAFYVKSHPGMAAHIPGWAADEMPAGVRGEGPHDYFAEAAVIREMAAEAGVEIVWDGLEKISNARHSLDCGLCCGLAECDCGIGGA